MIKNGRKYINIKTNKEVYCNGRVLLLPDKIPLIVYITLEDGQAKACKEETFLKAYKLE